MNRLDAFEIEYIRQWAASGNEPRGWESLPVQVKAHCVRWVDDFGYPAPMRRLNKTGLTIASLAEENAKLRAALVQANETAETVLFRTTGAHHPFPGISDDFELMRANLEELK